jgi:hypothetical protein
MSVVKFMAANWPLPEVKPSEEYPLHINLDEGTIYDGNADDNYCLYNFTDVKSYTDKEYGVILDWAYCTEGRARQIIEHIKSVLQHTDSVELWHAWLGDLEDDERPVIKTVIVSIADLTTENIQEWNDQEVWKDPTQYGDSPTLYCMKIVC